MLLKDMEEPTWKKSRIDIHDPPLSLENTLRLDPKREKERIEKVLPMKHWDIKLMHEPSVTRPYVLQEDPMRMKLLRLTADPRMPTSRMDRVDPRRIIP
jgi:hypothetical protein